jgi:16S rRNA (cytidine1402-2'-O)-methyltransferase
MPLFVVATPIGNNEDFSARALRSLKSADLVVGEELKVLRQILKAAGVQAPSLDQLNEHSDEKDIAHLVNECRDKNVVLVSDCGTPGFCDPGAELVNACYKAGLQVHSVPGPSSLMALLSIAGLRLDRFVFYGFLPAKTEARAKAWDEIQNETRPVVILETPYRLNRLVEEIGQSWRDRLVVLGLNLSQESERVLRGRGRDIAQQAPFDNAEPIAILLPKSTTSF